MSCEPLTGLSTFRKAQLIVSFHIHWPNFLLITISFMLIASNIQHLRIVMQLWSPWHQYQAVSDHWIPPGQTKYDFVSEKSITNEQIYQLSRESANYYRVSQANKQASLPTKHATNDSAEKTSATIWCKLNLIRFVFHRRPQMQQNDNNFKVMLQ